MIQEEQDKMKAFADLQDAVRRLDQPDLCAVGTRSQEEPQGRGKVSFCARGRRVGTCKQIKASPHRVAS